MIYDVKQTTLCSYATPVSHARHVLRLTPVSRDGERVQVAALAPVIDLVMLDPNNPRSVEFQLDRIETHLDALPKQNAEGRLSPAQQIAASIATRLRTINANAVDNNLIVDIENSLMKLSDAIGASFLTSNERTEVTWEALA